METVSSVSPSFQFGYLVFTGRSPRGVQYTCKKWCVMHHGQNRGKQKT